MSVMEVTTAGAVRASAFVFRPRDGATALAVVAKITYSLAPDTCKLSQTPEDVREEETPWEEGPDRSVHAPCDVAPFKRRAEVMLVGSAFAPGGRAVKSLTVRLKVGSLDKAIEVHGPRLFTPDDELVLGAPWKKMPLVYERAAGGPETWNPVGVRMDGPRDSYGQRRLPNLQPASLDLRDPSQSVPPVGFGPIASSWPVRAAHRRSRTDFTTPREARDAALGDDVDPAFFQDAPEDQQLPSLRGDEAIVLENLHPDREALSTRLAGFGVEAIYEPAGGGFADLPLSPDTLWIDVDRQLCTLTFRGHVAIADPAAISAVRVKLLDPSAARAREETPPPSFGAPARKAPAFAIEDPKTMDPHEVDEELSDDTFDKTQVGRAAQMPPLPFSSAAQTPYLPTPQRPAAAPPSARPQRSMTTEMVIPPGLLSGPSWLAPHERPGPPPMAPVAGSRRSTNTPPPPPPPPTFAPVTMPTAPQPSPLANTLMSSPSTPAPQPPSPLGSTLMSGSSMSGSSMSGSSMSGSSMSGSSMSGSSMSGSSMSGSSMSGSSMSGSSMSGMPATPPGIPRPPLMTLSSLTSAAAARDNPRPPAPEATPPTSREIARPTSVLAASNAASAPPRKETSRGSPLDPAEARPSEAPYVELLAFEPRVVPRLRTNKVFGPWMRAPGEPPPKGAEERDDRADVVRLLQKDPSSAEGSEDSGEPPIAFAQGTLQFPFDEVEVLRAALGVAKPLAAIDRKLKEAIDLGAELLRSDVDSVEAVESVTARIRDAWGRTGRATAAQLDVKIEQKLLESRKYQRRVLLEGEWLRAFFTPASGETVVAYLPPALERRLPMFARLPVRLLAELYPPQDPLEKSTIALKVVALARVAPKPRLSLK